MGMGTEKKYQLVLQFPEDVIDFDDIDKIETLIVANKGEFELDGHDIGSGELNFFILTNDPQQTFKIMINLLENTYKHLLKAAAFRDLTKEDFSILWPEDLRKFDIK